MYSFYLCIAINNQKCLTNHKTMMTIVNKLKVLALLLMLGQGCVCMAQNQMTATAADGQSNGMLDVQEVKAARASNQWFKVETSIHCHSQYAALNRAITRILFGKEKASDSLEEGLKQHMAEYESVVDPSTVKETIGQREKMVVQFKGGVEQRYLNYFVGYMQLALQGNESSQKNRERNFVFDVVHNKVLSLGDVLKPKLVERIKGDAGKTTIHMSMDEKNFKVSYKKNGRMVEQNYVYHNDKNKFTDAIKELVDWQAVEKREQDILAQNAKLQKEIEEAYGGVIKWTEKDKLERVPSFPGGDQAMMMWVFRNLKYPAEAKAKGIRGNVICAFIVEPDGQLSTVKVIKSLDPDLDAEAIRLVNAMPKWTPGKQNGEPVRVRYDLTVNFFMR